MHPFFFTLFNGYQCNKSYSGKKVLIGARENRLERASNFTKWNLRNEDFTCVFSIPVKFEIYFLGLPLEIVFGVWCNKSNEINPTKRFSLEPEKTTFKRNEDFTCVFSIPVKFIWDLFSWSSVRNCLWCYYRSLITSIALEKCKKNAIWLKIFWYKVFLSTEN